MASTYTVNSGIEKPGSGEQSGTWGTTTNTNFDIIDRVLSGVGAITLSGTTHTLSTSDGAMADGHYKVLVLGGSPSGTNTITISPNDQDKVYLVHNNTSQSAVFTQGSGSNATIVAGAFAWIFADGAGSGAAVTKMTVDTASIEDSAITTAKIAEMPSLPQSWRTRRCLLLAPRCCSSKQQCPPAGLRTRLTTTRRFVLRAAP